MESQAYQFVDIAKNCDVAQVPLNLDDQIKQFYCTLRRVPFLHDGYGRFVFQYIFIHSCINKMMVQYSNIKVMAVNANDGLGQVFVFRFIKIVKRKLQIKEGYTIQRSKRANNDLQNTTQNPKDRTTQTGMKTGAPEG